MTEAKTLLVLSKARKLLATVKTYDQAARIRSHAEALRAYSQQQKLSVECYNDAAEIKLRAERKMGGFLALTEKNRGGEHAHRKTTGRRESTGAPTLKELGVTKDESARYQKLARIPENNFEKIVGETNETRERLTTERVLREARGQGFISPPKRITETRVGSDGRVNVNVTLRLTEDEERDFLEAWDDLGERATPLLFKTVIQAAKKERTSQ
jgi:hypothetical protein